MLGTFTMLPSITFAKNPPEDSLLIERIYHYKQNCNDDKETVRTNVYMKWRYNTVKRNFALWFIPHMYGIAKGNRSFITETYGTMTCKNGKISFRKQLTHGTVPHHSKTMPTIQKFLTPDIYGETIYKDHILSPFHKTNRKFYRFSFIRDTEGTACVRFVPRHGNHTQLVAGQAIVDEKSGHIKKVTLNGEFDMIKFHTESVMNEEGTASMIPQYCKTNIDFKFLGNHITSSFEAFYNCPTSISDSVAKSTPSAVLLDTLRPTPLSMQDKYIYNLNSSPQLTSDSTAGTANDSIRTDTQPKKKGLTLKKLAWEIGDNLINSLRTEGDKGYVKLSPIINPQYVSYSHSKGFSYKMRLTARYNFNEHRYLEFRPNIGYNFKQERFYFTLPLRFTYNPRRNGIITMEYSNGNLITHPSIREKVGAKINDKSNDDKGKFSLFSSNRLRVTNNIMVIKGVDLETGFLIHRRKARYPEMMRQFGLSTDYRNFSPIASLKLYPWEKGPVFTIDYERGIKGVYKSHQNFERWEFDASVKHRLSRLRTMSLRVGSGFYSFGKGGHFLDYTNFRDNNLPEAWNDEWTGNFQLLNSRWYNNSKYYIRSNVSYESPLLFAGYTPWVGRYIERERVYHSLVFLSDRRPYHEFGYGFTTRWFSIGAFASFLQTRFLQAECKFTFELFNRW